MGKKKTKLKKRNIKKKTSKKRNKKMQKGGFPNPKFNIVFHYGPFVKQEIIEGVTNIFFQVEKLVKAPGYWGSETIEDKIDFIYVTKEGIIIDLSQHKKKLDKDYETFLNYVNPKLLPGETEKFSNSKREDGIQALKNIIEYHLERKRKSKSLDYDTEQELSPLTGYHIDIILFLPEFYFNVRKKIVHDTTDKTKDRPLTYFDPFVGSEPQLKFNYTVNTRQYISVAYALIYYKSLNIPNLDETDSTKGYNLIEYNFAYTKSPVYQEPIILRPDEFVKAFSEYENSPDYYGNFKLDIVKVGEDRYKVTILSAK